MQNLQEVEPRLYLVMWEYHCKGAPHNAVWCVVAIQTVLYNTCIQHQMEMLYVASSKVT